MSCHVLSCPVMPWHNRRAPPYHAMGGTPLNMTFWGMRKTRFNTTVTPSTHPQPFPLQPPPLPSKLQAPVQSVRECPTLVSGGCSMFGGPRA